MLHQFVPATVLFGCSLLAACSPRVDVLARLPSPDGRLDAVHAQPKTGATVGFVDWVYIVPHGANPKGEPIFVADKVSPALNIQWSGPSLMIEAQTARVFTSASGAKVGGSVVPVRVQVANRVD
ncbi:hypothetical protein [Phenylobacterium sp.]|uniref:hypothetical protein n=1 Tax=Phenylobacterium sp. TaxID=1871053 RepID=UPI0025FEB389|nr:hypothetical protein [Phenylobacterium sp.]